MTRTVLITGATSGFGAAAVHRFAQAGWKVIATGRRGERLRDGGVVAVNFINQGKPYTAVRFEHNGQQEFFDLDGRPLRDFSYAVAGSPCAGVVGHAFRYVAAGVAADVQMPCQDIMVRLGTVSDSVGTLGRAAKRAGPE